VFTLLILLLIASPFALVAFVIDTLRVADRRGGFPATALTYRAYGA
jgi:hypothetical protein